MGATENAVIRGVFSSPLEEFAVAEFASVRKDKGVCDLVGPRFQVSDGDPKIHFGFFVFFVKIGVSGLGQLAVFTEK